MLKVGAVLLDSTFLPVIKATLEQTVGEWRNFCSSCWFDKSREYLIDMSRMFPPFPPPSVRLSDSTGSLKRDMSHLYCLFRPEFVKNYRYPLCSDGFSGFIESEERPQHDDLLR